MPDSGGLLLRVHEPEEPKKKVKNKWLFTKPGEPILAIAGLWRPHQEVGKAFTMLTMPPGTDVAPYHDRQIAVLDRGQWMDWLDRAVPATDILRSLPAETLEVVQVG